MLSRTSRRAMSVIAIVALVGLFPVATATALPFHGSDSAAVTSGQDSGVLSFFSWVIDLFTGVSDSSTDGTTISTPTDPPSSGDSLTSTSSDSDTERGPEIDIGGNK